MNTVFCPVIENQIDSGDCLVICDVADGMIKPRILYDETPPTLPAGKQWTEELRTVCLNCKYHEDVN